MAKQPLNCSFCNQAQSDAKRLIAGPGNIHICDNCVLTCMKNLAESGDIDFGVMQVNNVQFTIIYAGEKKSFKLVPLNDLEAAAIFRDLSLFLIRASEAIKKE